VSTRSTESDEVIDYRALAELRHQIRRFLTFSEQEARTAGLEPQQHQLLLAVKGLPEGARPTVSTLAERLRLRHHTVVGLIDRLTAAKLAVRRPSKHDGREILVELTPKGERVLRGLAVSHQAELRSAAPALLAALEAIVGQQHTLRDAKGKVSEREATFSRDET
jgi:DNA-binding MarR family transcriptional regulator